MAKWLAIVGIKSVGPHRLLSDSAYDCDISGASYALETRASQISAQENAMKMMTVMLKMTTMMNMMITPMTMIQTMMMATMTMVMMKETTTCICEFHKCLSG